MPLGTSSSPHRARLVSYARFPCHSVLSPVLDRLLVLARTIQWLSAKLLAAGTNIRGCSRCRPIGDLDAKLPGTVEWQAAACSIGARQSQDCCAERHWLD